MIDESNKISAQRIILLVVVVLFCLVAGLFAYGSYQSYQRAEEELNKATNEAIELERKRILFKTEKIDQSLHQLGIESNVSGKLKSKWKKQELRD